jgi:hypothetical protein
MALSALAEYLMGIYGIHNIWVIHLSTIIEFLIIVSMFFLWEKNIYRKQTILILGCFYVIFWILAKSTFESLDNIDVYTSIVAQAIYIVLAVSLLFNVFKDAQISLKNDPRIWIASGLLLYSAGTIFVASLFNEILNAMPELLNTLWHINWILVILITLFFARGIWCQVPKVNLQNQKSG